MENALFLNKISHITFYKDSMFYDYILMVIFNCYLEKI